MANPGLIWLDESSAQRAISEKERAGEITAAEAAHLKKFSEDGYFIVPIELTAGDAATIDRDVDRLWRERPADVAFAYDSPPRRFSEAVAAWHSALMHGGATPANETRTRKSFVIHHSTLRTHPKRECAVHEMIQGVEPFARKNDLSEVTDVRPHGHADRCGVSCHGN